jgi:iron complex transport system substrate-binding protein
VIKSGKMHVRTAVLPLFLLLTIIPFVLALLPPLVLTNNANTTIVDMTGRHVSVVLPAKHVIILPLILADYIAIDQSSDHIFAISGRNAEAAKDGLIGKMFPSTMRLPVTGQTVYPDDPERLIQLQADAIFALDERSEVLDAIGMRSLIKVRLSDGSLPNRSVVWKLIGQVSGKDQRAEMLVRFHEERRAILKAMFEGTEVAPVRITILNGGNSGWWIANSRKYYLNPLLESVKAINVGGPVFSTDLGSTLEQLLISDPDIVLLDSDSVSPHDVYTRPEYRTLKAVRSRKVYSLPAHKDSSALTQELLSFWLADVCYPDKFPRRLRYQYRNAYREEFDYMLSDEEIDQILRIKENAESAGYSRFNRDEATRIE